jgi:Uma2 family endonuclease
MIQRARVDDDLVRYRSFRALIGDGQKADLIDGVIYMASPDTRLSNELNSFVFRLIADYIEAQQIDGFAFFSRFACRISDLRAPEPDAGYVVPERAHLVHDNEMEGGPDIAVEVVSRDSRSRDYGEKRELYEAAGVSEYWIIDPLQRRVQFLGLRDGRYELLPLENNSIFRSNVIPGFWLNVDWLLTRPLPAAYRCLQEILASQTKPARKRKK